MCMDITLGHDEGLQSFRVHLGFGDLALIFKVTAELNWSILSVCGGGGRHLFLALTQEPKANMRHLLKFIEFRE